MGPIRVIMPNFIKIGQTAALGSGQVAMVECDWCWRRSVGRSLSWCSLAASAASTRHDVSAHSLTARSCCLHVPRKRRRRYNNALARHKEPSGSRTREIELCLPIDSWRAHVLCLVEGERIASTCSIVCPWQFIVSVTNIYLLRSTARTHTHTHTHNLHTECAKNPSL